MPSAKTPAQSSERMPFASALLAAQYAYEARSWASLARLLKEARAAPDAPDPEDDDQTAIRTWEGLIEALDGHWVEVRDCLRVAVTMLVIRARERRGAAGAVDPTPEELLEQFLLDVETLDMQQLDEVVEEADRSWQYRPGDIDDAEEQC